MQVGQKQVPSGFTNQKRMRPSSMKFGETFVFRAVDGPVQRSFHMWPTKIEDKDTGVMKNSWRSVHVNRDETNILDKLSTLDLRLKKNHLEKRGLDKSKARSTVSKKNRYDYAIIPRGHVEGPREIWVLEANYTIYNAIKEISNSLHPTIPGMLQYGLMYMYDLCIKKTKEEQTGYPKYTVSVLNCTTEGKISSDYLDTQNHPIENPLQFFSPEDADLIENTDWDLSKIDLPVTPEKLSEILTKAPIDFGRTDKNNPNICLFFNDNEDLQTIQEYAKNEGLPHAIPQGTANTGMSNQGAISAPQNQNQNAISAPVDTQAEVTNVSGGPVAEEVPPTRPDNVQTSVQTTPAEVHPRQQPANGSVPNQNPPQQGNTGTSQNNNASGGTELKEANLW